MTQKIPFGRQPKAGSLDFASQRAFFDAKESAGNCCVVAGPDRMVGDHEEPSGFQRLEEPLVILTRSTDRKAVS
jgi:hypothetical protein